MTLKTAIDNYVSSSADDGFMDWVKEVLEYIPEQTKQDFEDKYFMDSIGYINSLSKSYHRYDDREETAEKLIEYFEENY